ncbi:MAG: type II CRISPR RNA-guided endonuclease Cas9 [Peptoniphilaceae bacterium]
MTKNLANKDYFVGLDIGTNSVGWAVTDKSYNLLKFNNHKMWGARLFEEASTAQERRTHRSNRRRLQRRKYRLDLLEEIFTKEIHKIDPEFFMRLRESMYHYDDRSLKNDSILFNDSKGYKDKDFFSKYPTIYHLRDALIKGKEEDIRAVFLAIHHIIKYRGHFLLSGNEINIGNSLASILEDLFNFINYNLGITVDYKGKISNIEKIALNKELSKSDKQKLIVKELDSKYKKELSEIFKLSFGLKGNMEKIFDGIEVELNYEDADNDIKKVQFNDSFEEKISNLEDFYGEYFELINTCKKFYDTVSLSQILIDNKGLSESKIIVYEKHKEDLKILKKLLKYIDESLSLAKKDKLYYKVLKEDLDKGKNYVNYSGKPKNGKRVDREEFYKFIKNILAEVREDKLSKEDKDKINYIYSEMDIERFLPLQRDKINGVIPYQLQMKELTLILDSASKYLTFLNKVEDGISNKEKIISLIKFRVPYYVGPLNDYNNVEDKNGYAWVEKKKREKIKPWNFSQVVDIEKSAEKFIKNLTNKCGYLKEEIVLPKNSIIYSKFMVLNELNNLQYRNQKLDPELKMNIYEDLFLEKKDNRKITEKRILEYIRIKGIDDGKGILTGLDGEIHSDMKSYRDMIKIMEDDFNIDMAEDIIRWITVFRGERKILKNKIKDVYGDKLNQNQIEKLSKLKYRDWGRLSKKLLTGIRSEIDVDEINFPVSILEAMEVSNNNFMQLLSSKYDYINKINQEYYQDEDKDTLEIIEDLYLSPAIKRSIFQASKILEEINKIMGYEPKKIFIEMTRTNKAEKNKTKARKDKLAELYKSLKKDPQYKNLIEEFNSTEAKDFKIKKLYLYFTQLGKCAYSGESINFDELFTNSYDIDHIYPRSKTKDDSIHKNLVLVKAKYNREKSDVYPLEKNIQDKMRNFWTLLYKKEFITEEKYNRLMRNRPLTAEELSKFIARQLVETSQSTKSTGEVLSKIYKNSQICYVKAENVSDFRHGSSRKISKDDKPKAFIKSRLVNDFHHAKDAYLNIVVGNVYDVKFTKSPINFIKNENKDNKHKYSLNYMFRYPVERNGYEAWNPDLSMKIVEKMMKSNDVRITRHVKPSNGALYDATLYKAKEAKQDIYFPIKTKDNTPLKDVTKYGGYTKIKIAYYSVYKYKFKNKDSIKYETIIIPIPIYLIKANNNINDFVKDYLKKRIKGDLLEYWKIYDRLYKNSLVKIDGYYYYLGGKTGDNIYINNGLNIIIDEKIENILNRISKNIDYDLGIKFDEEELIEVFDYLVGKSQENIFKLRKKDIYKVIGGEEIRKRFLKLDNTDKSKILLQIINILTEKNTTYDLKKIKSSYSRAKTSMRLDKLKEFKVINQSITGLYVNEKDILK